MKIDASRFLNLLTIRSLAAGLLVQGLAACAAAPLPPPLPPPPPPPPPVVVLAPPPEPPPPPPLPPPAPEPPKPLDLPGPIVFASGSEKLSAESEPALTRVAEYLSQQKNVSVLRIEGHTDNQGVTKRNQKLSEARAMSVAAWLSKSGGIDCKRLLPVGFGDTRPLVENTDDDSRAKNRRTVFIDAVVDGKEVGQGGREGGGHLAGDACKAK